jgi:uncharacterized protein involved in exopolysaccharide biosynthesis
MRDLPPNESKDNSATDLVRSVPNSYYVVSGGRDTRDDGVSLFALWEILWIQRGLIALVVFAFGVASIIVALAMTPVYRSEALLAPVQADEIPALASGLSALTGLAGLQLGRSAETKTAVARLRSREFAASFIQDYDLMKVIFADDWNEDTGKWTTDEPPAMFDAVKLFQTEIFLVKEDPVTGLVTASVEWKDAEQAAQWVNELVARINSESQDRALTEAEDNIAYLTDQLESSTVIELQQAIFRLIESEMKTAMLARARSEYAFKVIDPGVVPTERVRPRRTLIVIVSTILGGLLAVFISFLRHGFRQHQETRAPGHLSD